MFIYNLSISNVKFKKITFYIISKLPKEHALFLKNFDKVLKCVWGHCPGEEPNNPLHIVHLQKATNG